MGTAKQRLMKKLPVSKSVRTNYRSRPAVAFSHLRIRTRDNGITEVGIDR
jgi:hypothetical protein